MHLPQKVVGSHVGGACHRPFTDVQVGFLFSISSGFHSCYTNKSAHLPQSVPSPPASPKCLIKRWDRAEPWVTAREASLQAGQPLLRRGCPSVPCESCSPLGCVWSSSSLSSKDTGLHEVVKRESTGRYTDGASMDQQIQHEVCDKAFKS